MYDCYFDVAYARNGWRRVLFVVVAVLLAAMVVRNDMAHPDLVTWVVGIPQVALWAVVVLLLLRWLDNLRPQPVGHILFAFVWGATAAVTLADELDDITRDLGLFGLSPYELSDVTAGPREELTKIIPVLVLFLICRRSFNGVLSAIVIGASTGAGFEMTENFNRFPDGLAGDNSLLGQGGWLDAELTLWVYRVLFVPLVHESLTALAAVGFGIAAVSASRAVRILAPIGTLLAAMVWHSVHDTIGQQVGFLVSGLGWTVLPLVVVMIVVAVRARTNLRRLAAEELPVYAEHHDISAQDVHTTPSAKERRKAARAERRRHGRGAAPAPCADATTPSWTW